MRGHSADWYLKHDNEYMAIMGNPQKKERTLRGETRIGYNRDVELGRSEVMKSGYLCTIIRYNGCEDIDVQFEDGSVVNTTLALFNQGKILHPRFGRVPNSLKDSCDTIVLYHFFKDIFSDIGFRGNVENYRAGDDNYPVNVTVHSVNAKIVIDLVRAKRVHTRSVVKYNTLVSAGYKVYVIAEPKNMPDVDDVRKLYLTTHTIDSLYDNIRTVRTELGYPCDNIPSICLGSLNDILKQYER